MSYGGEIQRCRYKLDYSRSQLAKVLKVSKDLVFRWEAGLNKPPYSAVLICKMMIGESINLKPELTEPQKRNRGKSKHGKRLEEIRINHSLTSRQFCQNLNITQKQYSDIIHQGRNCYDSLIEKAMEI